MNEIKFKNIENCFKKIGVKFLKEKIANNTIKNEKKNLIKNLLT